MPHSVSGDASEAHHAPHPDSFLPAPGIRQPNPHSRPASVQIASQLTCVSSDGRYIACINSNSLELRNLNSLHIFRTIDLPHAYASSRRAVLRWSSTSPAVDSSPRILLASDDEVRVYDLDDPNWSALIDNGSGGLGKVGHVEFGSTNSEVLIFSSHGSHITVWSLHTGHSLELLDPKHPTRGNGRSRPGRSGVFALLSRPASQDVLTMHLPCSYEVLRSISLPTSDAQGLKWSPDGKWLAVWDTSSMGYKILIYTADGNLYRKYSGDYFDDSADALGVKSIEWSPTGDSLAVGGFEKTVTFLSTRTFSPAHHLTHVPSVDPRVATVYQETLSSSAKGVQHAYQLAETTVFAPAPSQHSAGPFGISIIAFNPSGSHVVTKHDAFPTTAWIWDLSSLTLQACLIQHDPIKQLSWHPSESKLLMIHTQPAINVPRPSAGGSIMYFWDGEAEQAQAISLTEELMPGPKTEATWVYTDCGAYPLISVSDQSMCTLLWPRGRDHGDLTDGVQPPATSGYPGSTALMQQRLNGSEFLAPGLDRHGIDMTFVDDTFRGLGKGVGAR